jgi:uncharacterized protein YdeI (YjbR/CyaY-like superfamily)
LSESPEPTFFETPEHLRRWLEENHASATELWVGFYKKGTGRASVTWPEAVDEALCFGWIDGVRYRIDEESYRQRFTPRRESSTWSAVNIRRMRELTEEGRVRPSGLEAFERRSAKRSGTYSYEQREKARLDEALERRFRAATSAWAYFEQEAPWYRKTAIFWVMSAKRQETRERRLGILIESSAQQERIPQLRRTDDRR